MIDLALISLARLEKEKIDNFGEPVSLVLRRAREHWT